MIISRVFDLHVDVGSALLNYEVFREKGFKDAGERAQLDLSNALAGGYGWLVSAIFPGTTFTDPLTGKPRITFGCSRCISVEELKAIETVIQGFSDIVNLIVRKDELDLPEGKLGFILGMEGSYPLMEPEDLIPYFRMGLRLLGLTWNIENGFAASCTSGYDYGLTKSGEKLIRLANDLGVTVDLAHASHKTMKDVLNKSSKPVIISHTASYKLNNHVRNVRDDILDYLVSNDGVVGISFVPEFLNHEGKAGIKDVVKHILHFVEVAGVNHAAIGTDYLGVSRLPEGLENASKIQSLLHELRDSGLSKNDIEKIAWKNSYRVFSKNLPK